MTKVFISHSTKNRPLVEEKILRPLREAGISWWYGPDNIEGGSEWEREILRGLRSCSHFILAMTPDAADSQWVRTEVHWAIENRLDTLLPVLLEPVPAEEFHLRLIALQRIDLTSADAGDQLLDLLQNRKNDVSPQTSSNSNTPFSIEAFDQFGEFFDNIFDKPDTPKPEEKSDSITTLQEAIGIEVRDNGITSFMPIFAKGTRLPSEHKVEFSTFEDNQTAVDVKPLAASGHSGTDTAPMSGFQIVDQDQPFTTDNPPQVRRLGDFSLNVLPQPKGVPLIDVTFYLDDTGTLDISAIEKITNRSASGIFDQVAIAETKTSTKVVVGCPSCGTSFRVPGDLRIKATCPGCKAAVVVNHGRLE